MIFTETSLNDAYIVELEKREDHRGFFARTWDKNEFQKHNLNSNLVQCNVSFSKKRGTLRGMHYQQKPFEESKLIRCTKGKIFDVIIDLRKSSSTFKKWFGIELTGENYKMLYDYSEFADSTNKLKWGQDRVVLMILHLNVVIKKIGTNNM